MSARRNSQGSRRLWTFVLLGMVVMNAALAHKGSDAYLDIRQVPASATLPPGVAADAGPTAQEFRFVLSVALRDLDQVVAVDADGDARITWAEVKNATPQMVHLLDQTVVLDAVGASALPARASGVVDVAPAPTCDLHWQADGLERRSDGSYLRAIARARCAAAQALRLHYALFREQDANHRLLVAGRIDGVDLLMTASPQQPESLRLRVGAGPGSATGARAEGGRWTTLRGYFLLGMGHLLQGYDHLAFLLALVLPLRLQLWRRGVQLPQAGADLAGGPAAVRAAWMALLRTITAFTVGHSVTLMLATLGWTQASPMWVEPVIALSIAATAALNLRPVSGLRMEWLALGFGMVHGYGFAGLLQEASAPQGLLGWALVGFNLGVEAGQLLAVAAWVGVAQWVVRRRWYVPVVVRGGSLLLVGLATVWFWQRIA